MATYPPGSVQVSIEPQLLFMRHKILIRWVHVFRRRWNLLLVQRSIQIWRIRQISVMPMERMRIRVALEHPEEAMGEKRWRGVIMMPMGIKSVRWQLGWKKHAVAVESRRIAHEIRVLLRRLEVAEVQRKLSVSNGG